MKNKLLKLFLTFFRIGLFTFGGGYAMIPLIQREAVEKNKWISDDDILDIIEKQGKAELTCHFCNKAYVLEKDELLKLIE